MRIELTRIYNNKPYYTMRHENGKISHAFGYEQAKEFINEAKATGEKIELEDTKFLDEHTKLLDLILKKN